MSTSSRFIGMALVLSVAAFALGLWPAVSDAPWEKETTIIVQDSVELQKKAEQARICLTIIDGVSYSRATYLLLEDLGDHVYLWKAAGCDDYVAQVAE